MSTSAVVRTTLFEGLKCRISLDISCHPALHFNGTRLLTPFPSFCPRVENGIDILIFNPPYVVTPPEEMEGHGISVSWAGGKDGRVVIDRFMPQVPGVLSPGGRLYLVCIKENFPDELLAQG